MNQVVEVILTVASVITALGVILGLFIAIHKCVLKQNKQGVDTVAI